MNGFFPAPEPIVQDLGPGAAVLYGRIWRYCQGGGTCYASLGTLAAECQVSISTVQRWIAALRDARYLTMKSGGAHGKTSVISTTRKWVMGGDQAPVRMTKGVGQIDRGGRSKRPGGVGQIDRLLKEVEEKREEKRERQDSSPFGVVVVAPRPALPDHDDDAGQGISSDVPVQDHEALDAIRGILAPIKPARLATVLAAVRKAAPPATADDIQDAADDWADRWERIKGHAPDPLQASQLPDVVAAWMTASRIAGRAGHGLVPMIEY